MAIHFYRKNNKKANNIFQVKTQIHQRAEALRQAQHRNPHSVGVPVLHESTVFRGYASKSHYVSVGTEPGYEHH